MGLLLRIGFPSIQEVGSLIVVEKYDVTHIMDRDIIRGGYIG